MRYEKAKVAVDAVILTVDSDLKIHLQNREKEPFKGRYELPGGLLLADETAEEALSRKLKEILGTTSYFRQFHTFTDPTRDKRERTISISYIAPIRKTENLDWYDYQKLSLAFDHRQIIEKAISYMRDNIGPGLVRNLLPEEFPLNRLQEIYETIEKKQYDNRNFRKFVINSGMLEDTGKKEENVSHRPARLFRFRQKDQEGKA